MQLLSNSKRCFWVWFFFLVNLSGFSSLRPSHCYGDIPSGSTICESSQQVLQLNFHIPV